MTALSWDSLQIADESLAGSGDRALELAIVGLGPWGLAALERLVSVAGADKRPVIIHAIDPGRPGCGIFRTEDPEYLPLNTPCGQHVMHPDGASATAPYARSLYEWASRRGYRWVDGVCRIGIEGTPISPHDFLPRRLMGEWLNWTFRKLLAGLPSWVEVIHHECEATGIDEGPDGQELIKLADGSDILVDHVVLTTGHTPDAEPDDLAIAPYPVDGVLKLVPPRETVAVAGLGLVALDVISTLTVGRGGVFQEQAEGFVYLPSGTEPDILLFSRSGLPYAAKADAAGDPTGEYEPIICTPEAVAGLRELPSGELNHGQIDFCRDALPLILAEMQVRFYRQSALIIDGADEATVLMQRLGQAWSDGTFDDAIERLADQYGSFDFKTHLLGEIDDRTYLSSSEYEGTFYKLVRDDLAEAMHPGTTSPVKAAYETLRVLRDAIRRLVEFQGLTLESYLDFQSRLANRLKAAVAGPPARRAKELLALMDAGVVSVPWGPSPTVRQTDDGRFVIQSTRLVEQVTLTVPRLVRGYLPEPTIADSSSPLIRNLADAGRIRQLAYGDAEVGSVELTEDLNPVGADGEVQRQLWILGPLTEGVRYFTQYVPSPKSRVRVFVDLEKCARLMLDGESAPAADSGGACHPMLGRAASVLA